MRYILTGGITLTLVFAIVSGVLAQAAKSASAQTTVNKEVLGEISGISKDYISLIYHVDAEKGEDFEIMLPIDENIRLVNKKNLKQLQVGDIVRVQFEETTEPAEKGPRSSRRARGITFVKSGAKK